MGIPVPKIWEPENEEKNEWIFAEEEKRERSFVGMDRPAVDSGRKTVGAYLLDRMDRSVSLVWETGITTLSFEKSSEADSAMLIFSFFCFLMVIVFSR